MKFDFLFKPVSSNALRIVLFILALILFNWGGLLFARSMSAQQTADDSWQLALATMAVGGLLLYKARKP